MRGSNNFKELLLLLLMLLIVNKNIVKLKKNEDYNSISNNKRFDNELKIKYGFVIIYFLAY